MTLNLTTALELDLAVETEKICSRVREVLRTHIRRRGLVIAMSGGIDSSVCAALAVRAVGPSKVFGLLLPEHDSSPASTDRGSQLVRHLGIDHLRVDISPALEALGCYQWRDEAIQEVFPAYGPGWKNKIAIDGGSDGRFNFFKLIVQAPDGTVYQERLAPKPYLQIVAATNFKQRVRKTLEFFHADRLNYAVVGTPNRLEYDQGFFVKNGDGSADIKPIAHLYKTQVYALARHLGLPEVICQAEPTTDTYSMVQGQDEFYFALPYGAMDKALLAFNSGLSANELAEQLTIGVDAASFIYQDIVAKRKATAALHWPGLVLEPVEGPYTRPPSVGVSPG